jgi:DNA-binding IclR family transcriptional regulator
MLATDGPLTATEVAQRLRVHQSSASRLLRSLQRKGYVYKPKFHQFALDFGVLLVAGVAMERFPEVGAGADVCSDLHRRLGCGVALAVLRETRMVYLARVHPGVGQQLTLVDDSSFPVHHSSPGLLLSYLQGRQRMQEIVVASMERHEAGRSERTPDELHALVEGALSDDGVLYLTGFGQNRFSASLAVELGHSVAALTLYGHRTSMSREQCATVLAEGAGRVRATVSPQEVNSKGDSGDGSRKRNLT